MTLGVSKNQSILLRIAPESQQILPDATVEEFVPQHAAQENGLEVSLLAHSKRDQC